MGTNRRQHTPGPWTYSEGGAFNRERWGSIDAWHGNNDHEENWNGTVAEICTGGSAEADARLIAAAPDLLEACRAAREFLEDGYAPDQISPQEAMIREMLDAAIAEATGGCIVNRPLPRTPDRTRARSPERAIARDLGVSVDELYRLLAPVRGRAPERAPPLVRLGQGDYARDLTPPRDRN